MKTVIGLTGPTGAGKSIAADAVRDKVFVINCDKVARDVVKKGSKGLAATVKAFGEDILENGELNRAELAKKAFSSEENTNLLNNTLFPFIKEEIYGIINSADKDIILLDAPTLFESGLDSICSGVITVLSDKNTRKERIILRDKISVENAMLRIGAGKGNDYYAEKADAVVYNDGDVDVFTEDFIYTFNKLTEELI